MNEIRSGQMYTRYTRGTVVATIIQAKVYSNSRKGKTINCKRYDESTASIVLLIDVPSIQTCWTLEPAAV